MCRCLLIGIKTIRRGQRRCTGISAFAGQTPTVNAASTDRDRRITLHGALRRDRWRRPPAQGNTPRSGRCCAATRRRSEKRPHRPSRGRGLPGARCKRPDKASEGSEEDAGNEAQFGPPVIEFAAISDLKHPIEQRAPEVGCRPRVSGRGGASKHPRRASSGANRPGAAGGM